jgi:hypothetical protein
LRTNAKELVDNKAPVTDQPPKCDGDDPGRPTIYRRVLQAAGGPFLVWVFAEGFQERIFGFPYFFGKLAKLGLKLVKGTH